MTEHLAFIADLEIRQVDGANVLRGSMAYGQTATISNRGRVRKERLGPNAMGWQMARFAEVQAEMTANIGRTIDRARREILEEQLERRNVHVLVGHDFGKPLGDLKSGTARVTSTDESLTFEVDLPDPNDMPTYMMDAVKQVRSGRAGGISPGFYIPPKDVVANAERLVPEAGNPSVMIREVSDGIMPEVSVVTRPVYVSEVDLRAEEWERVTSNAPRVGTLFL